MPRPQSERKVTEKRKLDEKNQLKGTFVSVMILGALIVVCWVGVWMLYLSR